MQCNLEGKRELVKKGFVLMETIVVISVLCVILVLLYSSYSNILLKVKRKELYDNTEYIYKAGLVRNYLEGALTTLDYQSNVTMYCKNSEDISSDKWCYDEDITDDKKNELFKSLGVESVYITIWNVNEISAADLSTFEATTQNYIKWLNSTDEDGYRIIIMFKNENELKSIGKEDTDKDIFEYASLRFGSRV